MWLGCGVNALMRSLWVLPATNQQLVTSCLSSFKVDPQNLIVVDNSKTGLTLPVTPGQYVRRGFNIGVAPAWNIAVSRVLNDEADMVVLLSQSITFGPSGGLDFVSHFDDPAAKWGVESYFAWHLIGIKRESFLRIGVFDEQFYPAYYEDSDWLKRARLDGIRSYENHDGWPYFETDVSYAGDAQALTRGDVKLDYGLNHGRYLLKWGGEPGHETYTIPYNGTRDVV